ncbi:MAG: hypothetical protein EU532_04080 [Promethearchaeota archaeon]|nr:MAG: hypothetical protein EU532_04080 [Candidatus Lokiarchaeota archaeon]
MLKYYFCNDFKGIGISEGIERGLLVDHNDKCIVQEGMGLGAPAIKTRNGTYFSCSSFLQKISENEYKKIFYIDSELVWEIFEINSERLHDSRLLTTFINKLTDLYKKLPYLQESLLKLGIYSRDFFQTKSKIRPSVCLGKIVFYYTILKTGVTIEVDFSHILKFNKKSISKICIMNELGGDYFDSRKVGSKIGDPPSGWVKINPGEDNKLYSKGFNLDFAVEILKFPTDYQFDFVYGREKFSNFCWAGYDIEIDVNSMKNGQNECEIQYICNLRENVR